MAPRRRRSTRRRREKKIVPRGRIYIQSTFNNTIVTVTDPNGNTLAWASGGTVGFKGARKSTPYAAQLAAQQVAQRAMNEFQMREVDLFVKGPGPGREAAIRTIQGAGLLVRSISDITPIPHNGCRPPKKRRV